MKRDPVTWESLHLVGYMPVDEDDLGAGRLELRNCGECHSTIAIEVQP